MRTLDDTRYYTGSSNQVNLRNSGPYQFQPLDAYYGINRGFSVELGIPSVPTLESLKSFIPEPTAGRSAIPGPITTGTRAGTARCSRTWPT